MNHDDATTPWRKSSYSNSGANCVEVARTRSGKIAVRDSRNAGDVALSFRPGEWRTFVAKVQAMAPVSLGAWAPGVMSAGRVEPGALLGGQFQVHGGQALVQLRHQEAPTTGMIGMSPPISQASTTWLTVAPASLATSRSAAPIKPGTRSSGGLSDRALQA
jgi:Domain of unknown function (DUF397)